MNWLFPNLTATNMSDVSYVLDRAADPWPTLEWKHRMLQDSYLGPQLFDCIDSGPQSVGTVELCLHSCIAPNNNLGTDVQVKMNKACTLVSPGKTAYWDSYIIRTVMMLLNSWKCCFHSLSLLYNMMTRRKK